MATAIRHFFKTFLLLEMIQGLVVTGRHLFAPKITVQYPEQKAPRLPRFR